jgi:hypothetical protein
VRQHCVFALATSRWETRRAIEVAQRLAAAAGSDLAIVVPLPEQLSVSSARANVYDVAVDDAEHPDPKLSVALVHELTRALPARPQMIVMRGFAARHLASVVPAGATVVICGPMHRLLETPEQRLARQLAKQKFDVVFLPSEVDSCQSRESRQETEEPCQLVS